MTVAEGKEKFIQSWGALGSNWGINRTMAQIHALLLISAKPLSTDDIRKDLKISLGNANMNIRALIDWGLVYKTMISGERKDYFIAEKDMGKVVKQIIIQRKKKELDPMIKVLDEIAAVETTDEEAQEFLTVVKDIRTLSEKADNTLDKLVRKESEWLVKTFMKMM
jgi:DNA-binding transcriptional regulator GbsR (MarR family)